MPTAFVLINMEAALEADMLRELKKVEYVSARLYKKLTHSIFVRDVLARTYMAQSGHTNSQVLQPLQVLPSIRIG